MDRVVAVGLGSNLGDRHAHLTAARSRLSELLSHARFSPTVETEPVGVPDDQPNYLNAAAVGRSGLTPRQLLDALMTIEREQGRQRAFNNAARTLDLDLLLVGELIVDEPGLTLPHPRFRERRFVLEPLAAIAPELRDPVSGLTVAALLRRLPPAPQAGRR